MRAPITALLALMIAACRGSVAPSASLRVPDTVVSTASPAAATLIPSMPTVTGTVVPEPSATAARTDAPQTASPSVAPEPDPLPVEVVRFGQSGQSLFVEIHNPNADFGLVRSGFELAVIGEGGDIITVVGSAGLVGAACCTIYQLPPGGRYTIGDPFLREGAEVASVELTVLGEWERWSDLEPATVTLSNVSMNVETFDANEGVITITGRAAVDQPGPFNAVIQGYVEGANGFVVVEGYGECLGGGSARAFEGEYYGRIPRSAELDEVVAYVTTVEGAGDTSAPPGC